MALLITAAETTDGLNGGVAGTVTFDTSLDGGIPNPASLSALSTVLGDTVALDGVMFSDAAAATSFEDARLITIAMSAPVGTAVGTSAGARRKVIRQRLLDHLQHEMPMGTAYRLTVNGDVLLP